MATFPHLAPALAGRWAGLRFLVGPWAWMLLVYRNQESTDRAVIITILDSRSAGAATPGSQLSAGHARGADVILVCDHRDARA